MSTAPTLAPDAAMVLGIAATAIPFARTPEDEAERWLRLLRLHGEVGATLQALGVSEDSLREHAERTEQVARPSRSAAQRDAENRDVIARVGERASRIAQARGVGGVGTTDLLMAVLEVYGGVFERALRAHGTDVEEVLERLAAEPPAASSAGPH
jgi:ATP-dependent Clp protease ATP-binding subunit ClpA